jgi:hypothetical protein
VKANTIKGRSPEEIKKTLHECISKDFRPTLALVFLSIKQDRGTLIRILDDAGVAIYGATSNGEFTGDGVTAGEIAIMLLDIDPSHFSIFFQEFHEGNYREVAQSIARKAQVKFAHPCFLIAGSGMHTNAEALLYGFEDILGKEVNVNGGMAGDDFGFIETFVFTNKRSTNNGIIAVALDADKINMKGRATFGWKPVGTVKTVTKSEGNHVFTVDDVPVFDLTMKYGGLENVTPENFALEHFIALTLQLQRDNGDPIMRAGFQIDWNDHSMYCGGPVPQGSKVRFSLPPDFDAIEKVIKGCEALKTEEIPEADALILFNCAGRLLSLGPMISEEIEGIRKVWNAPIAGMFSNAELARATKGNLEMHGFTACTVALKEK